MIAYDPSEQGALSEAENQAQACPGLEELTGGDWLCSPSLLPVDSEPLLRAHLANGAVLFQIKRSHDFTSSVGTRLHTSLARMKEVTRNTWQRVLCITGTPLPDSEGLATMSHLRFTEHGKPYTLPQPQTGTHVTFAALITAQVHWSTCGGAGPFVLPSEDYFLPFLRTYERAYAERVKTILPHRLKLYEPVADDPLQTLQLVNDGREILAALPGIGLERATLAMQQWSNAATALAYLSNPRLYHDTPECYPRGIGEKTIEKIHAQLGGAVEPVYFTEGEY